MPADPSEDRQLPALDLADSAAVVREAVRCVARGPRLHKPLTREHAAAFFSAMLEGAVEPLQLGAVLAALRVRGETADELTGCVMALRRKIRMTFPAVDLCIGSPGDGKTRSASVEWMAACLTQQAGIRVALVSSESDFPKFGVTSVDVVRALGLPLNEPSDGLPLTIDVASVVEGYAPIRVLRQQLFLRSVLHSAEKTLNPCGAACALVGITHPPYYAPTADAIRAQGARRAVIVQGAEGSSEATAGRRAPYRLYRGGAEPEPGVVDPDRLDVVERAEAAAASDAAEMAARLTQWLADAGDARLTDSIVLSSALQRIAAGDDRSPDAVVADVRAQAADPSARRAILERVRSLSHAR